MKTRYKYLPNGPFQSTLRSDNLRRKGGYLIRIHAKFKWRVYHYVGTRYTSRRISYDKAFFRFSNIVIYSISKRNNNKKYAWFDKLNFALVGRLVKYENHRNISSNSDSIKRKRGTKLNCDRPEAFFRQAANFFPSSCSPFPYRGAAITRECIFNRKLTYVTCNEGDSIFKWDNPFARWDVWLAMYVYTYTYL